MYKWNMFCIKVVPSYCYSRYPLVDAGDGERSLVLERLRDQVRVGVRRLAVTARRIAALLLKIEHHNIGIIHHIYSRNSPKNTENDLWDFFIIPD